jgi:hypothetical protein
MSGKNRQILERHQLIAVEIRAGLVGQRVKRLGEKSKIGQLYDEITIEIGAPGYDRETNQCIAIACYVGQRNPLNDNRKTVRAPAGGDRTADCRPARVIGRTIRAA